jgi:hypothetical protein
MVYAVIGLQAPDAPCNRPTLPNDKKGLRAMNRFVHAVVMLTVLLACSTAGAHGPYVVAMPIAGPAAYAPVPTYVAPPQVITIPTVPVPAAVAMPARVVVRSPVVVPAPVVVHSPVVVPAPVVYPYVAPVVVPAPAVIRAKVYYPGQPVRNALRAVLP